MILSAEQERITKAVIDNIHDESAQSIGGLAGTGKTTIFGDIHRRLTNMGLKVLACTPTGKAAQVLRQKHNIPCKTIHEAIYRLAEAETERKTITKGDGTTVEMDVTKELRFTFRGLGSKYHVIMIDEASMVSESVYLDILKAGLPIIAIGDHGQLPPVKGSFSLMKSPDYRLETVQRHAGPIAGFCHHLRHRSVPSQWDGVFIKSETSIAELAGYSQVICGTNRTRTKVNHDLRKLMGRKHLLEPGDRIISLANNRKLNLFNGTQCTVVEIMEPGVAIIDVDGRWQQVKFLPQTFGLAEGGSFYGLDGHPFDYSYCITCHKAQGSEWNHVAVIDESKCFAREPGMVFRWRYTAASRARESLLWAGDVSLDEPAPASSVWYPDEADLCHADSPDDY